MLIVDGTLVPTRDHSSAEQSKNYRYSTNHQVVIDADTRLVVMVGRPVVGNRNDCKAWEQSGAKSAIGRTAVRRRHPLPPRVRAGRQGSDGALPGGAQMSRKISICAPTEFSRSARSSYPRLMT